MNIDLNLSGNYVINKNTKEDRMQFFYASQCYGTLFAIYLRINLDGDFIKDMDFKLINYKGILNIGFISKDINKNQEINILRENENLVIKFPVKAMTKTTDAKNIKPDKRISIKGLKTITGERTLKKFASHTEKTYQEAAIFDEEFYHRNGNDDFHELKPNWGQEEYDHKGNKIITANCVQTILKVVQI